MRQTIILLSTGALLLAGCGKRELSLPSDPVDRAATCAVVAALEMRKGSKNVGALAFDQQTRLMHYAMLEAASTPSFSQDTAAAAVKRTPELEPDISKSKWEVLKAPCAQAYPAATKTSDITLSKDPLESRLGCYALASFVTSALQQQDATYGPQLEAYMDYRRKEDAKVSAAYAARGIGSNDAKDAKRKEALSTIVKLGSPTAVMKVCVDTYGAGEKAGG